MRQMYKVFTKQKCIFLLEDKSLLKIDDPVCFVKHSSLGQLLDEIEKLEKNLTAGSLFILHEKANKLWADFKSLFKIIEAAGGLVRNSENKILFIFRNDKWDLPKGKIEKGEEVREAAIREVKEECGIKNELSIVREISSTYHIYVLNGERILKKTYWFEMVSQSDEDLKPQIEEGITDVQWLDSEGIKEALKNTYPAITEVISNYTTSPYKS